MKYFKLTAIILTAFILAQLVIILFFYDIPVMRVVLPILSGFCIVLLGIAFISSGRFIQIIKDKNRQITSLKNQQVKHEKQITTMDNHFDRLVKDLKFINTRSMFMSNILDNIHVNVYVVNRKGIITSANKELLDTLKLKESEVVGKSYHLLSNIEHDYLDSIFDSGKYNRTLNNVEQSVSIKGEKKQILKSISPVLSEDGDLVSVVVSFVDVNRLKLIENRIMQVNKQLSSEMKMARRVQRKIIPDETSFNNIKNLKVAINYSSLQIMGGDIFDIVKISDDEFGFFIADVSGHGMPASLITAMLKVSFVTHSKDNPDPAMVFSMMNDDIFSIIEGMGYFVSAYYCVINVENGGFRFANAGHPPALFYHHDSGSVEELDQRGTLLGVISSKIPEYRTGRVTLDKGDRILLYTDGVTEAKNQQDEIYSKYRLIEFMKSNSNLRLKSFVKNLIKSIEKFSQDRKQTDDRAILYMEYKPKNKD